MGDLVYGIDPISLRGLSPHSPVPSLSYSYPLVILATDA